MKKWSDDYVGVPLSIQPSDTLPIADSHQGEADENEGHPHHEDDHQEDCIGISQVKENFLSLPW